MDAAQGDRLRGYIDSRWSRKDGGIRGFCKAVGITPETVYSWFRGETSPSWENLGAIADVLEVRRFQLVAAIDGDAPVVRLDPLARLAIAAEVRRVLDEQREPPEAPPEPSGAGH